ncbi:hypothetical protein V6N12_040329 [Hibiscus sabdariffa]|uniref:Uncharacterized protein n=1 Tax=Hibiscus sabdariffa TaxID=183260 RepID=A0ABR2E3D2_9ROSI
MGWASSPRPIHHPSYKTRCTDSKCIIKSNDWGCSSNDRALALHARDAGYPLLANYTYPKESVPIHHPSNFPSPSDPLEDFCQANPGDEECKVYEA